MKTIFIDGYFFEYESLGGISRMWSELIKKALLLSSDVRFIVAITSGINNFFLEDLEKSIGDTDKLRVVEHGKPFYLRSRFTNDFSPLRSFCNRRRLAVDEYNADVFHSSYMSVVYPRLKKIPAVVTVHDLILQKFRDLFVKAPRSYINYYRKLITENFAIRNADHLIAVSETSKKDIIEYFNFKEDKIKVIHHGIREFWFSEADATEGSKSYYLFVGGRNPYKNYDTVLKALSLLEGKYKNIKLVVVGDNKNSKEAECKKYHELNIADRIIDLGIVTDDKLKSLYSNALALVFPSIYEGFGFPLLESLASRCPVIASDIPTNREFGDPFVRYFSTLDSADMAEKMVALYDNPPDDKERDRYVAHARNFTWDVAARKLTELYRNVTL